MAKKHLHETLGITFQELGGLLGARNMLAAGLVPEAPDTTPGPHEHGFNMNTKCTTNGCGTVSCIGGLMALIMGKRPGVYVREYGTGSNGECSPALGPLFYPTYKQRSDGWGWITPQIAVLAIDNFLHDGESKWDDLQDKYAGGAENEWI